MGKSQVIGFVVASLVSVASLAPAQASAPNARHERHGAGRGMEGRPGRGGLFRGISLTDAEKSHVKQIHTTYRAEAKTLRESLLPAMRDARAARQKGDTAGVKAAWSRTAGDRSKLRALMDREKAEIRGALTPEHQHLFDANAKQRAERRADGRKNTKSDRNGRAGRARRGVRAS
ncbi:MAG: Spy/CpxP family protein refolding chaperone [Gemmatimonadaceae bacterium]